MQSDDKMRAQVEKVQRRMRRSFEYLEKRFDLGFISEEEYDKKRKKLIKKYALRSLADSEALLENSKRIIRKMKLSITRWTQRSIKVLAEPDGLQRIGELEKLIREQEKFLEEAISVRKTCLERIIQLKEILKKVS